MEPKFPGARMMTAEAVVDAALRGLETGKRVVIPGVANALIVQAIRLAPRRLVTRFGARIMRPQPRQT
jgi:short-subunit dehydrogenase